MGRFSFLRGRWLVASMLLGVACSAGGGGSGVDFDGGFGGNAASAGTGAVGTGGAAGNPGGGGGAMGGSSGSATGGVGGGTGAAAGTGATGGTTTTGGSGGAPMDGGGATDSGVSDSSMGGAGGSDASTTYGDCCSAHGTPGCTNTNVQKCVCNIDATCCAIGWNAACVQKAFTYNCAACPDGGVTSGGGTGGGGAGGDCCFAHTSPGCNNAAVQSCVCAVDSYCCTYEWDSICAGEVTSVGCGTC